MVWTMERRGRETTAQATRWMYSVNPPEENLRDLDSAKRSVNRLIIRKDAGAAFSLTKCQAKVLFLLAAFGIDQNNEKVSKDKNDDDHIGRKISWNVKRF